MRRKFLYGGKSVRHAGQVALALVAGVTLLGCGAAEFTTGTDPRVRFASSISASATGCGTVVVNNKNVQTYNVSASWQVPSGTWRAIFVNVLPGQIAATTAADATQTKSSITVEDGVAKSCEFKAGDRAYAILQPAGATPVAADADATQTIVVGQ